MGIKEGVIRIQVAREIDEYKSRHGGKLRRGDFFNNIHTCIPGLGLMTQDQGIMDSLVYQNEQSYSRKLRGLTHRQFMEICQRTAKRIGITGEILKEADIQLADAYYDFVNNHTPVEKYNALEQNLIKTIWLPLYMELRMQGFNYTDITR